MSIFYAHKAIVWNIKRENCNRSQITKIVGCAEERLNSGNCAGCQELPCHRVSAVIDTGFCL